jgi:hypothetical protein
MDKIKINEGVTVNLGNYQSYRLDIEYSKDFDPNITNRDEIFTDIEQYIDKKLKKKMKDKVNAKIVREE